MSDDLESRGHHAITHNDETYIKLADAAVTFSLYRKDTAAKDAEITRLRAELATATQWRNAINDALASWHNQIDEEETPKEAIDRLIGYETAIERLNALDPSLSQDAADLVATARRDALAEIKQDTDELIEQGRQDGMEYAGEGKS